MKPTASMEDIIDCIPSKDLKGHLIRHPVDLSIMQKATIVYGFAPKRKKLRLLQRLSEETKNAAERILLETAIREIRRYGYADKASKEIYDSLFPHEGFPLYPFLEICDLPVLFHKGDLIAFRKRHYYVGSCPNMKENCDFSDENYLCYDLSARIENKEDLFCAHEHIHVCLAEAASIKDLSKKEQETLMNVKRMMQDREHR